MCSKDNNILWHCQICVNSKECLPADAARLFGAEDLLQHIYAHLNYRPHKCNQCAFAASSPSELIQHSQKSMHYQLTLYNAENIFLKEICEEILEKCRQKETLAPQQYKTSADFAHSSQSSSPIPSLNSSTNTTHCQRGQQMDTFAAGGGSKMAQNFSMQMNSLPGGTNCDNLPPVPKGLQKAVNECILGVSEVFASIPPSAKPNDFDALDNTKKAFNCASFEQRKCILCGNVTNSITMKEYHCNTHLNLPLYRCRFCTAEFTKYIGWRKHTNDQHQRKSAKYERVEANWEELRKTMKAMFVPIGDSMGPLHNRQTPSSSSNTLALAEMPRGDAAADNGPIGNSQPLYSTPATVGKGTVTPVKVKTEFNEQQTEELRQNGGAVAKKRRTLSKVQCAECDEFLPDTEMSRLNHTNVKHLMLCLFKCPMCAKEFTSTFNGLNYCVSHIKWHHSGQMIPYDEEMTMDNLPQKMVKIRARASELFP
ncbi:hypothetical protein niasHS_015072 [Heterodera schachtii]|uniref:C2H2-type domain-containing protein n=1 Tax=Heterodera schachtii TaxID=97005 RepID=A0ABD2I219_HETSC